jgi:hypothetical protein
VVGKFVGATGRWRWKEAEASGVEWRIELGPTSRRHADASSAQAAAFERFVRDADRRVRAVVYRMVGDDVDDVMQTAYVRAFRGWAQFAGRSVPSQAEVRWRDQEVVTSGADI